MNRRAVFSFLTIYRQFERDLMENCRMRLPALPLPAENFVVMLLVGLAGGWIAAKFVQRHGLGIVGDIIVGVIGAYVGNWALSQLGVHLGTGLILGTRLAHSILNAAVGAVVLLLLIRLIRWIPVGARRPARRRRSPGGSGASKAETQP